MIRKSLTFFLLFISTFLFAQRNTSSPYSIFGVGEEFGTKTVEQIGMGGIGAAFKSYKYLNFVNPAANANLTYATYVFGLLNNELSVKSSDVNQTTNTTSLSYFALGIPISKKLGFVFGMQPTSAVGYSLRNSIFDSEDNLIDLTTFSGTGSVNRLYTGFGWNLYKGLSVGAEIDFLFGNIENSVLNSRLNVDLSTRNVEDTDIRGGSLKVGVHYETELKNKLQISLGASAVLENTLKATGNEYLYSLTLTTDGGEIPRDTIFEGGLNGRLLRPLKTVLGGGIGKADKWYAGVNYSFQNAIVNSGYFNNSNNAFLYDSSSSLSIGGFYLPKSNSISSYWERVTYRIGMKYEETGLLVNGNPGSNNFTSINDFGISFGLGLPLGNRVSNINFSGEIGKRGTLDNGLLQENYFNLRLSLSFNDIWFKKRIID